MKNISPKIIFMGSSNFSEVILRSLIENRYDITSVYTRLDQKVGRKQIVQKTPVKVLAEKNKIKIYEPIKFDQAEIEKLKKQKPDLIIVASYGIILPKTVLEIPKFQCLNVHPSLLPDLRGPSPIQSAILNGYEKTGTTIMLMNEKMDEGDILVQEEISVTQGEKFPDLHNRLGEISSALLVKTIPEWIAGKIKPQKQKMKKATYSKIIKKEDGKINWNDPAEKIFNYWRAYYSWPGIYSFWENKGKIKRLKLIDINFSMGANDKSKKIGQVFQKNDSVCICSSQGSIIIKKIQPEGKGVMPIKNFLNGNADFLKAVLK